MTEDNRREKLNELLEELVPPEAERKQRSYTCTFTGTEITTLMNALYDADKREREATGDRVYWELFEKIVRLGNEL